MNKDNPSSAQVKPQSSDKGYSSQAANPNASQTNQWDKNKASGSEDKTADAMRTNAGVKPAQATSEPGKSRDSGSASASNSGNSDKK